MNRIIKKEKLNHAVGKMVVEAPLIAKKAQPGQFIILRAKENSERIPLTIADYNKKEGTITIIYQIVGSSTMDLDSLKEGDFILDFVGPLGKKTEIEGLLKVLVIGGGVGCAIAFPIAKKCKELGIEVHSIIGFRNKDFVILKDEFISCSSRFALMSDDGSVGEKGFVTTCLEKWLKEDSHFDCVFVVGPLAMMKAVSNCTRLYGIKTIVSMNPIMIDGTGMCGGCRLTVGGKVKFACVDGPDFNGHEVDFDEAISRSKMYEKEEKKAREHTCNLYKKEEK